MTLFSDIYSSFRQTFAERLKSPFLGAFAFAWLGFNWQLLAVLFLGKDDIFKKLDYINKHFDIGSLLLGPIFTTILLSILIPLANWFLASLQSGNNFKFNRISLVDKIKVSRYHLRLSEIEARKKLSEEKERRFIESNIKAILDENRDLKSQRESDENKINELSDGLLKSEIQTASLTKTNSILESSLKKANDGKDLVDANLSKLYDENLKVTLEANTLKNELSIKNVSLTKYEKNLEDTVSEMNYLKSCYSSLMNDYKVVMSDMLRDLRKIEMKLEGEEVSLGIRENDIIKEVISICKARRVQYIGDGSVDFALQKMQKDLNPENLLMRFREK